MLLSADWGCDAVQNLLLFSLIFLPVIGGILMLLCGKKLNILASIIMLLTTFLHAAAAVLLYNTDVAVLYPWAGFGFDFEFVLDNLSYFIILATAMFSVLVAIYSLVFLRGKEYLSTYGFYYLLTVGFVSGAVLCSNMGVMLFFWEGLLVLLFGMLIAAKKTAIKTAIKALVVNGVADICLMFGIGITCYLAGSMHMSEINKLPLEGLAIAGFILMMLGAVGKAGAMPFHSWIPAAAKDAPVPFMAFLPAALEKLLGIYLLIRIVLNFYDFQPGSAMSILVMILGSITIIFAVFMALIQKDFKKLLSYHAISQVGYMVLGIGTALPVGIVGGLFHMLNHAVYKCLLFLTSGAVEYRTGTTNLKKLGGIANVMPVTTICFLIAALSISGVPPFNGFFSKEMVFDAAIESGVIYYIIALVGAFFTAASFLKLGHSAFFTPLPEKYKDVKEAPLPMLLPMIILAFLCVFFGLFNEYPLLMFVQPAIGDAVLQGESFAGFPANPLLLTLSLIALFSAVANHILGMRSAGGNPLGAADHFRYCIGLKSIYDKAEKGCFDPYNLLLNFIRYFSLIAYQIDRKLNMFYDVVLVKSTKFISAQAANLNKGKVSIHLIWVLVGIVAIFIALLATV